MTPRQWRISVDVLPDATLAASVTADDQLLMPQARFATPSEALAYLEGALVDCRRGDSVSTILTTQGADPRICLLSNRDSVLSWLGPVLVDLWHRARQPVASAAPEVASGSFGVSNVTRTRRRLLSEPAEEPCEAEHADSDLTDRVER